MELLLNLLWLMLAVPAIWFWHQEPVRVQNLRSFRRFSSVVLLGCILMLLFPVVSATDDLHAMRPEMEEPGPSKRMVKQVSGEKSHSTLSGDGTLPAQLLCVCSFYPSHETCGKVLIQPNLLPEQAQLGTSPGRAPPTFSQLS